MGSGQKGIGFAGKVDEMNKLNRLDFDFPASNQ
jgi:hypothetical protein